MRPWVIVNGQVMEGDRPAIPLDNRAYHYGDGVFESIRVVRGRPSFLESHWMRCQEGLKVLRIERPEGLDLHTLAQNVELLVQRTGILSGRCRLTVFREGRGQYRPEGNNGGYTIELLPLSQEKYTLNETGLTVDIWPEMRKPVNVLSIHKTLNCQYYIMAGLWSQERGLDDCLLQNDRGNIIESSSGNLFIVSNGVLYTPSLSDGCLGGIMRMQIINLALANGMKVYECSLNPQNLLAADELFFTNAVRGVQWAGAYRTKRYAHRSGQHLVDLLNALVLS